MVLSLQKKGLFLPTYCLKVILLAFFAWKYAQCVDCKMTETISFSECRVLCRIKYGQDQQTQRRFFNRFTGMCEPKVECEHTKHRVYQNRCVGQFEKFDLAEYRVIPIEEVSIVRTKTIRGRMNKQEEHNYCFPGFHSSGKYSLTQEE